MRARYRIVTVCGPGDTEAFQSWIIDAANADVVGISEAVRGHIRFHHSGPSTAEY